MSNNELLLSISDMLDQKLQPIEKRMDALDQKIDNVEKKLNAKIDNIEESLSTRMDCMEYNLKGDIHLIHLKFENIIEPRLNEIESCYISTFKRYQQTSDKLQSMETDLSVLKSVVQEHSYKLNLQPA